VCSDCGRIGLVDRGRAICSVFRFGEVRWGVAGMEGYMSKFVWKDGSVYSSKAEAGVVGRRLQYLMKKNGGKLTADVIVEDAVGINSPLHNLFEWDDTEAARKYRERQARDLLVSVRVLIEEDDGEEEPYRAFVNIIDEDDGSVYVDSVTAVCRDEYREQLLVRAVREINAWLGRYHELQELAELQKVAMVMKRALLKIVTDKVAV
jgi:hypothetical protein